MRPREFSKNCAMPVLLPLFLEISVYCPLKSNWPLDHAGCSVENLTCWYSTPILKLCFPVNSGEIVSELKRLADFIGRQERVATQS